MEHQRRVTAVPKRTIIDTLLNTINHDFIRQSLHINTETDLRYRLDDFPKADLLFLLTSSPEGEKALTEAEPKYPLHSPPTFYLAHVQNRPSLDEIIQLTEKLVDDGRNGGIFLNEPRAIPHSTREKQIRSILNRMKEKCSRNN